MNKKPIVYVKWKEPKKPHHGNKKWNKETGSSLARVPRRIRESRSQPTPEDSIPEGLTGEQYRLLKMEESKKNRERLNQLLNEDNKRVQAERKASVN